ncbi:MAG: helix-turn-helix transcriptional regulator [Bacteroidetes bacterium]|nr:helix-turn-helix transcriptional regulator [Bacteroidota bacterium]
MKSRKKALFPKHIQILVKLGENIRLARKRRKLKTTEVAERAGIDRSTLYKVELGSPSVSIGAYFNVLRALGLQNDLLKLAVDDAMGRDLQDAELLNRK